MHTSTCGRQKLRKKLAEQGITATHVLHFREPTRGIAWPAPRHPTCACGSGQTSLIENQVLEEITGVDNHDVHVIEVGRLMKPPKTIVVGSRRGR